MESLRQCTATFIFNSHGRCQTPDWKGLRVWLLVANGLHGIRDILRERTTVEILEDERMRKKEGRHRLKTERTALFAVV